MAIAVSAWGRRNLSSLTNLALVNRYTNAMQYLGPEVALYHTGFRTIDASTQLKIPLVVAKGGHMKARIFLISITILLGASLVACSDDDDANGTSAATGSASPAPSATVAAATGTSGTASTGDGIDRAEILGSLDDVKALIRDNASSLDPEMIGDVSYTDGELHVTLAESQDDIDTSKLNSACDQISKAISLPDMKLVVEKADGSDSVECEFNG